MGNLLIRNLDPATRDRLEACATANQRFPEDEVRETLRLALARDDVWGENLVQVATRLVGRDHGVNLDLSPRHAGPDHPRPDAAAPDGGR